MQKKMVAGIAITANKILRFQGANIRRAVRDAAAFRRVKEGIKNHRVSRTIPHRESHLVEP